jgi:hypothetical protein
VEYRVECGADGIATVTAVGRLTWSSLSEAAPQVLSQMQEAGCDRVLFDFRDTELALGTLDLRDFAASQLRIGFARLKRALVASHEIPDFTFYEHASRNLGQDLRVFNDMDKARAWLLEDPRPK